MSSPRSQREVANQFIMTTRDGVYFQSYDSVIVFVPLSDAEKTQLDVNYWDYSRTTAKYRNAFLGEDTDTIKAKIKSGEYVLVDLNK